MTRRPRRAPAVLLILAACLVFAGCAARRAARSKARILDPDTLYKLAIEDMEMAKPLSAKQFLERIQYTPQSRSHLEPLVRLAYADLAFQLGDDLSLIDARAKYLDFVILFGDRPEAPYAQIQAGVCSLRLAAQPTKDQTQTLVAITDFKELLRRFPASPYVRAATDRIRAAEYRLAEHDFAVGKFYFKRRAYLAAADRFRGLLGTYPRFAEKEKVYFFLGEALVRTDNDTEGRLYLEKLIADYPNGEFADDARKSLARLPASSGAKGAQPKKG